ncbi:unannotated protein [freshwater metagenome]|uniref:Unannotated protein n=1 Tax=freshwater metagenome TaxID=449393 RepID=A0A6J6F7Z3_9ZZZZ
MSTTMIEINIPMWMRVPGICGNISAIGNTRVCGTWISGFWNGPRTSMFEIPIPMKDIMRVVMISLVP